MAWTCYQITLAVVLVITGSLNTLSTKWADKLKAVGKDGGEPRPFTHPFLQACAMFLGEFLCLVVFKIVYYTLSRRQDGSLETNDLVKGNQNFSPWIFLPPAMLDMIATSTMYVGLTLTYAGSFQMFRGSVIVFVAILSVVALRRKIAVFQWIGILLVIVGLVVVGASDFLYTSDSASSDDKSTNAVITGDILIIVAQVITACQMVYEEKFVTGKDVPALQAVGWEGTFGFIVLGLLLIPFYYIIVPGNFSQNPNHALEDAIDAFVQMGNNPWLIASIVGTIISIAFFNFAGISVTKEMSATTRMILDSVRTLFIWITSLALKWESFHALQIPGFILLIIGMCVYNNLMPARVQTCCGSRRDDPLIENSEG